MRLGELFFDIGLKTKGIAEAINFNGVIEKTKAGLESVRKAVSDVAGNDGLNNLKGSFDKLNVAENRTLSLSMSLKNMFGSMLNMAKNVALGIVGIGTSIFMMMKSASNTAMDIDVLSSSTGKSVGFLYNMKKFAAEAGVSWQGMGEGIKRVKQISADISLGKASPSAFYSALGIDPHADYEKQLGQLSDAFKRFPENLDRVRAGARDMGFSEEEIYLAQKVTNIYEKLNKEIGSEKAHQRMVAFHKRMTAFGERMQVTLGNLAMKAEPLINKILNAIEKTVNILNGKVGKEWSEFFTYLTNMLPPMQAMLVAFAYAISPFTVKLSAFLWVLKEIWAYTQGKDNIFSSISKYVTDFESRINDIIKGVIKLGKLLGITDEEANQMEKTGKVTAKEWGPKIKSILENIYVDKRNLNPITGKTNDEFHFGQKLKPMPVQKEKTKAPVTNHQTLNINVNESKDPKLTAQLIQKTVGDAYWQLQRGEA